jgi:hypothetical protein
MPSFRRTVRRKREATVNRTEARANSLANDRQTAVTAMSGENDAPEFDPGDPAANLFS